MVKVFSRYGVDLSGGGSITIPHSLAISITNAKTYIFGFKLLDTADMVIFEKPNEYKLEVTGGNIVFSVYDGIDYEPSVNCGAAVANTWYRVVATVDVSSTLAKTVYVNDGSMIYTETTQNGSIAATSNDLVISGDVVVDLFAAYDTVFSGSEVTSFFNRDLIYSQLASYFSFEEGERTSVYDAKVDDYYGTIINGVWTMGKDMEDIYNSSGKVVVVRRGI